MALKYDVLFLSAVVLAALISVLIFYESNLITTNTYRLSSITVNSKIMYFLWLCKIVILTVTSNKVP